MESIYSFLEQSENLLDVLPTYQQQTIKQLLSQGNSNEEVARIWLAANGPSNTFPFGADNQNNSFLESLKKELYEFICNEEKYVEERKKINDQLRVGGLAAITSLASIIGATIGAAAPLILPVIVLLLDAAIKIGINVWCSLKSDTM